jgi:hypothetical protein
MLDFVDKAFDPMAFPIQPGVVFAQQLGTLVRRNDGLSTACQQVVSESPRCILQLALKCQQSLIIHVDKPIYLNTM